MIKELEKSINDLMWECYELTINLAYSFNGMGYVETVKPKPESISDELWDEIWCWVDGLYQKRFFDSMNGRCSFYETINFDITKEETYMKDFLGKLKAI